MKNNYLSLRLFFTIVLLVFFILTLFPILQLVFYAHPSDNDNYVSFNAWKNIPLLKLIVNSFFKYGLSCRYSASVIAATVYTKIPVQVTESVMHTLIIKYRILALIQIICFTLSLFYLCYSFNKYITRQSKLFFFSIFALSYYILLISSTYIFHTFYEMISASGYTTGLWLTFLLIGLLIDNYYTNKKYSFIAIVIFFICGMLEIFPIIAGSILLYPFILKIINKKKIDYIFIVFGIFIITVFLLNFFNPVQAAKLKLYGNGDWVTNKEESRFSIHQIMLYLKEFLILWYNSVKALFRRRNILFTVTLTTVLSISLVKKNKTINIFSIIPYYIVIAICGFSFHYSYLSILSLQRANNLLSILISLTNVLLFTALEGIAINFTLPIWHSALILFKDLSKKQEIQSFIVEIKKYFDKNRKPISFMSIVLGLALTIFLIVKPGNTIANCYNAILTGSAKQYDRELVSRCKIIINSDTPIVYVPKLSNPPQVLFYSDSLENGAWAYFFNKEKLLYTNKEY